MTPFVIARASAPHVGFSWAKYSAEQIPAVRSALLQWRRRTWRRDIRVQALTSLYRQRSGRVLTVGISAGLTEPSLLREVDIPIVVLDSDVDPARVLRKVPTARVTSAAGSAGWDEAILMAVDPELAKVSRRR